MRASTRIVQIVLNFLIINSTRNLFPSCIAFTRHSYNRFTQTNHSITKKKHHITKAQKKSKNEIDAKIRIE